MDPSISSQATRARDECRLPVIALGFVTGGLAGAFVSYYVVTYGGLWLVQGSIWGEAGELRVAGLLSIPLGALAGTALGIAAVGSVWRRFQ